MRKYELLFITHPDYDEEKIAAVMKRYEDVISGGKGVVKTSEKWGKRRLAYELNGLREGLYILMVFEADREVSAELDRLMKIDQDILRHMISRLDHERHKISPKKKKASPEPARTDEPRVAAAGPLPVRVVRETSPGTAPEADGGVKVVNTAKTLDPQEP